MSSIQTTGAAGTIHVEVDGEGGTALVCLPSLGGTTRHFEALAKHFAPTRKVLRIDLRGHGSSAHSKQLDYAIPSFADDVRAAMDAAGVGEAILVGHSFGALVALAFAEAHPARVRGVVLLDPAGDARQIPAEQTKEFLDALESDIYWPVLRDYWLSLLGPSKTVVRQPILDELNRTIRTAVSGGFREMLAYDPASALQNIRAPLHVIRTPANDTPGSLQNLLPGLSQEVVEKTGHWPHLDAPDEVNRRVEAWLDRLERPSTAG